MTLQTPPTNEVISAKLDFIKDLLLEKLGAVDRRVDALTDELAGKVGHHEFHPVRIVAFGLVGLILTGVVGALLKLVIMGS